MSRLHNARQNHSIKLANESFENEGKFRYFENTTKNSISIEPRKSFRQTKFLVYVYLLSPSYLLQMSPIQHKLGQ
jgi:hypothetical protein